MDTALISFLVSMCLGSQAVLVWRMRQVRSAIRALKNENVLIMSGVNAALLHMGELLNAPDLIAMAQASTKLTDEIPWEKP